MSLPAIAVLGCGYWGQNLVRNFNQIGALRLVCDPSEVGRQRAAQIAPGIETCSSFDAVFARKDIQAIVLATPAETHHPLALKALAAGFDLLVEKPLAMTFQQGVEMQQAAEKHGRILMVGHLLEYHPAILKLRDMIAAGELGRVNYIYSNRLNFGKVRIEENALWSFAPHDVAAVIRLFGAMPLEATCVGGSYLTPNLQDTTVSCLHFLGGQRAHIFVSWLNPFKEQKTVIVGTEKMAVSNDVAKEDKLVVYDQRVEMDGRQPILQKGTADIITLNPAEPLRRECEHFLECVVSRKQPLTDAAAGIRVLKVLQACQVSLQLNGRPTLLSEIQ